MADLVLVANWCQRRLDVGPRSCKALACLSRRSVFEHRAVNQRVVSVGEAVVSYLGAVGIRARVRPLERAAFMNQWNTATGLRQSQSSSFGNAVTRIERHMISSGDFAFGSYPEIDDLFRQQMREPDRARRETLLHAIQRIAHERVMFAPIWQAAQLNAIGARIEQSGIGLIEYLPYSAPYEDLPLTP